MKTKTRIAVKPLTMTLWCSKCKAFTMHILFKTTGVYVCGCGHVTGAPQAAQLPPGR